MVFIQGKVHFNKIVAKSMSDVREFVTTKIKNMKEQTKPTIHVEKDEAVEPDINWKDDQATIKMKNDITQRKRFDTQKKLQKLYRELKFSSLLSIQLSKDDELQFFAESNNENEYNSNLANCIKKLRLINQYQDI